MGGGGRVSVEEDHHTQANSGNKEVSLPDVNALENFQGYKRTEEARQEMHDDMAESSSWSSIEATRE